MAPTATASSASSTCIDRCMARSSCRPSLCSNALRAKGKDHTTILMLRVSKVTKLSNASSHFKLDHAYCCGWRDKAFFARLRNRFLLQYILLLDKLTYVGLESQIDLHAQLHASLVKPCNTKCLPSQRLNAARHRFMRLFDAHCHLQVTSGFLAP